MKQMKYFVIAMTFILLWKVCIGKALNPDYDVNVKCTITIVAAGTSVGGSVRIFNWKIKLCWVMPIFHQAGLSIGAIIGGFLFPGLGIKGGLVIGLILGSSVGSGGAGAFSQKICQEAGVIF